MEKKLYINHETYSPKQVSVLGKVVYLYSHSHRYIKRRVNGDNARVLQIKFKDEEKLNKFLEVIETNHIKLIDPKQLEKDGRKERPSKNYR